MPLRDRIEALVSTAPPDATVTVRWLGDLLSAEDEQPSAATQRAVAPLADLTVRQVAAQFGRGPSTVRGWLARGELPGAYRSHGREWRIPATAVEAMQRAQAERHRAEARPRQAIDRHADLGEWRKHFAPRRAS